MTLLQKVSITSKQIKPVLFLVLFLIGCSQSVVNTYTDPGINSAAIKKIAIFPIRNARLLPGESNEILRSFTRAVATKNPGLEIMNAAEAINSLNDNELADVYADFLRDYAVSGVPNNNTLKKITEALQIDGFIQGEVIGLQQISPSYAAGVAGTTSLTLRYYLLSSKIGSVLWEASVSVSKRNTTIIPPAPPVIVVIKMALEQILPIIPRFSQ